MSIRRTQKRQLISSNIRPMPTWGVAVLLLVLIVPTQAFGLDCDALALRRHGLDAEPEALWEGPEEPLAEGGDLGPAVRAREGQ